MAETPIPRRFAVGYALSPKKQQTLNQPSLVASARDRGIDLVPISPALPLADQGPFDCVLHKLHGESWSAQLQEFAARQPGVPVVDPPLAVERLHNRVFMLQVVSELRIPQERETFGVPRQVVVHDSGTLSDPGSVGVLRFPVIAKPLLADGSAKSHSMSLVFRSHGLLKLKLNPPLVLQEFVNHGGVVFKVYVAGDYVQCVKRKSLPDVSEEKREWSEGAVTFSQVSNMAAQDSAALDEAEMPPLSFLTDLARGLRRAMGLRLFNFDVIRDAKAENHYLVIDINYFPGYEKLPFYEKVLTDFLWNIIHENKEQDAGGSAAGGDNEESKLLVGNHCKMDEEENNVG